MWASIRKRSSRFVSLNDALQENGDAITIDDAIIAAYDAAKILVKYGHKVTVFINPYYIEERAAYWFCFLDTTLKHQESELNKTGSCDMEETFKLYRRGIKSVIQNLPSEPEKISFLERLFKVQMKSFVMESALKTLTKHHILELKEYGVDIQNHGWFHKDYTRKEDTYDNIFRANEWMSGVFGIQPSSYAVPFGGFHSYKHSIPQIKMIFYNTKLLPTGRLSEFAYNREMFYQINR